MENTKRRSERWIALDPKCAENCTCLSCDVPKDYTKWEHFFWWKTATCCNPQDGEMGKRDKNKLPPPRCHLTNFDWSKCRFLKRMVPSVFTNFPVQSEYILIYHRNSFIASADNVLLETGSISSNWEYLSLENTNTLFLWDFEAHILKSLWGRSIDRDGVGFPWKRRIFSAGLQGSAFATNLSQTTLFMQYLCAIKRKSPRERFRSLVCKKSQCNVGKRLSSPF